MHCLPRRHPHPDSHALPPSPPLSPAPRLGTIDYLAPEILGCPVKSHPMEFKDNPEVGYTYKASGVVWFMAY